MDENSIKAAALTRIRRLAKGRSLPVVASEFSLNGTGIRADLAILDRKFIGMEIKSARDTLKRLPSQMEGYARYFDQTVLVIAPKHIRGLRGIDLHGAEVWRCEVLTDWLQHADGQFRHTDGHWLLQLLTAEEERRAARVVQALPQGCTCQDIDSAWRAEFEKAFRRRYARSSSLFWETVAGRQIRAQDVALLSRFHADRERARIAADESAEMWSRWAEQMTVIAAGAYPSQSSSVA